MTVTTHTHAFFTCALFLSGLSRVLCQREHCAGTRCFAFIPDSVDFSGAEKFCKDRGGKLMTQQLPEEEPEMVTRLLNGLTGRFWLGQRLPDGRCPELLSHLSSAIANCSVKCAELNLTLRQESCLARSEGFLCQYEIEEPCSRIQVGSGGAQVTYTTPMGTHGESLVSLPPGTIATKKDQRAEYPDSRLICFRGWSKAPWQCGLSDGGCEHSCEVQDQPVCLCPEGQSLHPNNITCTKDPCAKCEHGCNRDVRVQGSPDMCVCRKGYRLAQDQERCLDVDECVEQEPCTVKNEVCKNTPGEFECHCAIGFLEEDGECVDVSICSDCEHMLCEKSDGVYGCLCRKGFKVSEKDQTKCELNCTEQDCLVSCIPGKSFCTCPPGYIMDMRNNTNICTDIDECDEDQTCEHQCVNSFGSYKCLCDKGFKLRKEHECEAVDEENGSGSTPPSPSPSPSRTSPPAAKVQLDAVPSYVKAGSMLGITVFLTLCLVLMVLLVRYALRRCRSFELTNLKREMDIFYLQQVTTENYKRFSFDKQSKSDSNSLKLRVFFQPWRRRRISSSGTSITSMRMLALHLAFICAGLQVTRGDQSCILHGLAANCASYGHAWIPALPPYITQLFLELNYISEINSTSLVNYEDLQNLDLGMQRVPLVIRNNAFRKQRKLTRLVLEGNVGLQLELNTFVGLWNLQTLHIGYCSLTESFLRERYLQPLWSLETLDLFGNKIERLQPGQFFVNLKKLTVLNLKLNPIKSLCEEDLSGFRGKFFTLMNLNSNHLYASMSSPDFDWEKCGNPFRSMSFNILELSSNGLNANAIRLFFKAIDGTPIKRLMISGIIGKGFSFNNLADPDHNTFEGLTNSTVDVFDLSRNFIFSLQKGVFSSLRDVTQIDISQNKINEIHKDAFSGLQEHLLLLNLSSNLLGEVYSETFTNLAELRVLDLSNNHIGVLGYGAFGGLPKLRGLYLTGNSLRDLGSPAYLPNLDLLSLNDNKLNYRSLGGIVTLGSHSIYLDMEDNRLTNLEDIYVILTQFSRLKNFFYGGNFVKWCTVSPGVSIPPGNSLQVLDLHDSFMQVIWSQGMCLNLFDHLDNLIGLNLTHNNLAALPPGIFWGLTSMVELDLSSNALTYLQSDIFPDSLKNLKLAQNFLASPDPAAFRSLLFVDLARNRFYCDCNLESFLTWMNTTNVTFLSPVEEFRCEFPANLQNVPLLDYTSMMQPCEEDDEKMVQELKFAFFVLSTVLVLLAMVGGIVYARLRGQIFIIYKKIVGRVIEGAKPPPPADDAQYDAYLCFSDNNYRWVEDALLEKLDNQFSEKNLLRCCFEARDFLPGEDYLSNIRDAVWGSRRTVCVVSKEFLKDGWCLEAFTLAQGRMLEELKNILIMLVVGKVAHYQLMKCDAVRAFVKRREYLVWPEDPQDLEWFYQQLVSQILKDTKVKEPPEDRKEPAQARMEDRIQLEPVREVAM
ncbi:toll-like receptor 5 [Genypterus blacodes]|uniref:toll-like receptor 5 n=1 Tax=Genypterus blacodes TaxID=154954 RepID=UPI003F76A337